MQITLKELNTKPLKYNKIIRIAMSLYEELYEDSKKPEQDKLKNINKEELERVQDFLKVYKARRWNVVTVGFGDQLIKDKDGVHHSLETPHTIKEMKEVKGLNYGSHEFSYDHPAIILSDINLTHIHKTNTLLVAPISSTQRRNAVLLEKDRHAFLANDSWVLLDHITNIGIERIKIGLTRKNSGRPGKLLSEISAPARTEIGEIIKKIFGIR